MNNNKELITTIKLNNEIEMPLLGIGTFKLKDINNCLKNAIENCGYLRIDTASMYGNEEAIGETLQQILNNNSKIERKDLFITSKLSFMEQGYQASLDAFDRSLSKLKLDYLDCYLIHWPGVKGIDGKSDINSKLRRESWKAIEKLYLEKKIRSIGVSNYTISHLKELSNYSNIPPVLNQVEFHILNFDLNLLNYCKENNIILESYGSLGGGRLVNNEDVIEMAKKVGKTPSQLLLRWCIEHKVPVIPKTENVNRIVENSKIFDFEIPLDILTKLDSLNKNQRFYMDPNTII